MNLKMRKQKSLGNLRLQAGKGTERSLSKDVPMVPEAETLPRNATAAEVSAAIKLRKSEDLLRERAWEQQVESGVEQKASKSADLCEFAFVFFSFFLFFFLDYLRHAL